MKYLSPFIYYLLENKNIGVDEIEDLLIPISDLGIKYKISRSKEPLMNNDKYEGSYYTRISFYLDKLDTVSPSNMHDGYDSYFSGDVVFDFLDEIVILRNRLESSNIFLSVSSMDDSLYVSFLIIDESNVTSTKEYKIKRLSKDLRKNWRKNSMFYRYAIMRISDDGILVSGIRDYSDIKYRNFIKDVNLVDFDVSKDIDKYNTKINFKIK